MGLPSNTVLFLVTEGIDRVEDLADFSDTLLENVAKNGIDLKKNVSAMSLHRLKVAAQAVRFYIDVGQPITVDNNNWSPVLKNFEKQWATVDKAISEAYPPTPPITKANPLMKWMLTFAQDHLSGCIGVRGSQFSNVIRDIELVPAATPLQNASDPSQPLMPHSEDHGLVKEELAQRASHDEP